ncbi:hypothetical protein Are01nite_72870 [Actinoplanes regularis]|nr:hypothetical protein Are01nite_72870 [Actinoplanes regularis]
MQAVDRVECGIALVPIEFVGQGDQTDRVSDGERERERDQGLVLLLAK